MKLRRDHQHGDGEGKGGIDECFQPRHLQPAQPESIPPGQGVQVCRQGGRQFFVSLFHRRTLMPELEVRWNMLQKFLTRRVAANTLHAARRLRPGTNPTARLL